MRSRIFIILISILSSVASQASPESSDPSDALYQVEALVFRRNVNNAPVTELFGSVAGNAAGAATTETGTKDYALYTQQAGAAESDLGKAAIRMAESGKFTVLAHTQWVQTADTRSGTKPVHLQSPLEPGLLNGEASFYVSRFLHLDLKLELDEKTAVSSILPFSADAVATRHFIDEHRRIKTTEVNYFDHPHFGALVLVTPLGTAK